MQNKEVNSFFKQEVILEKTNLGLTNDVFFACINNHKYAIRIPKDELVNHLSFSNEKNVIQKLHQQSFALPLVYYNEKSRLMITSWIDEAKTFDICNDADKIKRSALLIKAFHNANIISGIEFDAPTLLNEYISGIKNPIINYSSYQNVINAIANINNKHILCHNDLVPGNLLFTDTHDYLIDYEYAKDNDPYFDLMSFITENNINDTILRKEFLSAYFGKPIDSKIDEDLLAYERFHNLLWCAWANMMFDKINSSIYKDIMNIKKDALEKSLLKTSII